MAVEITGLAPYTYLVVGIVASVMAYLGWRSYQNTGNVRLLFVVIAFIAMVLKAILVMVHEWSPSEQISHHSLIVVMGILDVLIVLLFFMPFLSPRKPRTG